MSGFTKLLRGGKTIAASTIVTLPPSAFADTWPKKPIGPTKIGLRLISENETTRALSQAASVAWEELRDGDEKPDEDLLTEVFNDTVVTNVLARACALPEDISRPFFAPAPEALIRAALTAGGIRRLWDAYYAMQIASCPMGEEATDEQIAGLAELSEKIGTLPAEKRARVRRLLAVVIEELGDG